MPDFIAGPGLLTNSVHPQYAIMLTEAVNVFFKYILHSIDLRNENPWENKPIYMRYVDIVLGERAPFNSSYANLNFSQTISVACLFRQELWNCCCMWATWHSCWWSPSFHSTLLAECTEQPGSTRTCILVCMYVHCSLHPILHWYRQRLPEKHRRPHCVSSRYQKSEYTVSRWSSLPV